jgi:DNA-binding transcriptional regulator YiaG
MDGAEFKAILRSLEKSQVKFANELGVALRTVHYWGSKVSPLRSSTFWIC